MDFITADKRLTEASLGRVDQFTKDRHIGIIHSTATRQNTLLYWLLKPVIAITGSSAFASAVDLLPKPALSPFASQSSRAASSTLAPILARNCFAVSSPCNKASKRMMRLTRRWL